VLVLAVALVPLAILARQNADTNGGQTLLVLPFAAVGFVLAWRRPGNPLGWLLLTIAICFLLSNDSGFYAAAIYRLGHHLPLGLLALVLYELWGPALGALLMVILLFPDGWPPPGPWRRVASAYSAVIVLFEIALVTATLGAVIGHGSGSTASTGSPPSTTRPDGSRWPRSSSGSRGFRPWPVPWSARC
jgi:hypothetical protein